MVQKRRTWASLTAGLLGAVVVFAALSAGGLVQFSYEMGAARWALETIAYAFTNKVVQKLIASLIAGLLCGFVANMIVYGASIAGAQKVRAHKAKTVLLDGGAPEQVGKTA